MRSLVMSGGGCKGSFSAGIIKYLLGDLGIQYSSMHGVSSGAINVAFLAQFSEGQEKEASEQMAYLWSQLNTSKVYKRWWPFGGFHVLWRSSFFNSKPLMDLIRYNINLDKIRASGKEVTVGVTSLSTGEYHTINQSNDHFIEFVLGSSAFPSMLCPIEINNQLWIDGGVQELSPIHAAIDAGADEIDIITTSPEIKIKDFMQHPSIVDIFKRTVDLSTDRILANDIEKVLLYNELATAGITDKKYIKLNIFRPEYNLIEDQLNFDPIKINEMLEKGYFTAKKQLITTE